MKKAKRFIFSELYDEPEKITIAPDSHNEVTVEFEENGYKVNHEGNFERISSNLHLVREILEEEGFEVHSLAEVDEEREAFKDELLELLEEDEMMANGDEHEIIYEIDDIIVYGGFEDGYRGIDHNILLSKDVDWEDIIEWGTVVVPETMTYISNDPIEEYEDMGYENLPIDDNHIMGYKRNNEFSMDYEMEL